jgi:hypothetical protein
MSHTLGPAVALRGDRGVSQPRYVASLLVQIHVQLCACVAKELPACNLAGLCSDLTVGLLRLRCHLTIWSSCIRCTRNGCVTQTPCMPTSGCGCGLHMVCALPLSPADLEAIQKGLPEDAEPAMASTGAAEEGEARKPSAAAGRQLPGVSQRLCRHRARPAAAGRLLHVNLLHCTSFHVHITCMRTCLGNPEHPPT